MEEELGIHIASKYFIRGWSCCGKGDLRNYPHCLVLLSAWRYDIVSATIRSARSQPPVKTQFLFRIKVLETCNLGATIFASWYEINVTGQ
jgi:hypothetical protein